MQPNVDDYNDTKQGFQDLQDTSTKRGMLQQSKFER